MQKKKIKIYENKSLQNKIKYNKLVSVAALDLNIQTYLYILQSRDFSFFKKKQASTRSVLASF